MKTVVIKQKDFRFLKRWAIAGIRDEYYGGVPQFFEEGERLIKQVRKLKPLTEGTVLITTTLTTD